MSKHKIKIINIIKKGAVGTLAAVFAVNFLWSAGVASANLIDDLNNLHQEAEAKKDELTKLKKEIDVYVKSIQTTQGQSASLENQIKIFNDKMAKIELEIEALKIEIETLEIEIDDLELTIKDNQEKREKHKGFLVEYLKRINKNDQVSYLEIFILNDNFSEFFDELKYLTDVQDDLKESIRTIRELDAQLNRQKSTLEDNLEKIEKLTQAQENERRQLAENKDAKTALLAATMADEQRYQSLLTQAKNEQQAADAAIARIEKEVREKLELIDDKESGAAPGQIVLSWPVAPLRGISAYFHDPTYPYRYLFEHPAIDIPSPQSTAIRAPAPGYVATVHDAGYGYNYLMIVHKNGFSTVYGHVSGFDVAEDTYVTRGQVVARVGGAPGTKGAGRLTTGSHLHFEVRLNGIPVNPLNYLP